MSIVILITALWSQSGDLTTTKDRLLDFYVSEKNEQHAIAELKSLREGLRQKIRHARRSIPNLADRKAKIRIYEKSIAALEERMQSHPQVHPKIPLYAMRTGLVGYLTGDLQDEVAALRILQVIDHSTLLLEAGSDQLLWLDGVTTRDLVDGRIFAVEGLSFEVVGTKAYTTTFGSSRTVFWLRPFELGATAAEARAKKRAPRQWTDATGDHSVLARFVDCAGATVTLERDDAT
jgi:hypothetical protein